MPLSSERGIEIIRLSRLIFQNVIHSAGIGTFPKRGLPDVIGPSPSVTLDKLFYLIDYDITVFKTFCQQKTFLLNNVEVLST